MDTVQNQIMGRIKVQGAGGVFTPKDFLDLASRDAIDQSLARLVTQGMLQRIGRGLYHHPRINKTLGIAVPPDPDTVAQALGRQTASRVVPSPAVAANQLGLSTQVPARPVYLTDGRSRKVRVGSRVFDIRHAATKSLPASDSLGDKVIYALRAVGPGGVDDQVVGALRRKLSPKQRLDLVARSRYSTGWIADAARRVAGIQGRTHDHE